MTSVFAHSTYKEFLRAYLHSSEKSWGLKSQICEAMGIHSAYLSQVLGGSKHLSLEQIERLSHHLHLSEIEMEFLLLMVQKDRAGTKSLEKFFDGKLELLREKHSRVSERLGKKDSISEKDQNTYFSSWIYSAVHACALVPGLQTARAIAERLRLSEKETHNAITFLKEIGLLQESHGKVSPSSRWIRLKSGSPQMVRHHQNARFRASESIYRNNPDDLHYSAFFAFSREDFVVLKELWLKALKESQAVIKASPEEDVFAISLDIFEL